jgi:hypothetical protein
MNVDNKQHGAAAGQQPISAPGFRWLSAPGAFRLKSEVEAETKALRWILPPKRVSVSGITIPGGVYVGTCQRYPFSFVIDPTQPIGAAEKAEPIVPSRYPIDYFRYTKNQRAYYLKWLRGDTQNLQHVNPSPYLDQFLSGLECRLFVQGDPDDTLLDACERLAFRDGMRFQYRALELLSWWGQFRGPIAQLIVLDESIRFGFTQIPGPVLSLALANIASTRSTIPVHVAVELGLSRTITRSPIPGLRERLRRRLLAIYPSGLPVPRTTKWTQISYSPACPELKNSAPVRQGSPLPRLEVPDVASEIGHLLDPIVSSILSAPDFDPEIVAAIAAEKEATQQFLVKEFPPVAEEILPVLSAAPSPAPASLNGTVLQALRKLLTRATWTKADFNALAQEFRLMPSGFRIQVNRCAQEKFGDLLLDGTEPIQLNPYIREQIEKYL